jgi:hypothetical protein
LNISGITAFLVLVGLASPAFAGAWLREKGAGFSSVSASTAMAQNITQTTYLEYGVRDDLTLGAEVGFTTNVDGTQTGTAAIFLRRPIGAAGGPHTWSYELGMGASWGNYTVNPFLKTGLSWGRGYKIRDLNGWIAVDASVLFDVYDADHSAKIDSTIGLNFTDRFAGMIQIFHTGNAGGPTTSVAPSFVVKPLRNKPAIRLQIGGEAQIGHPQSASLKLSLWRDF